MMSQPDLYATLGLTPGASKDDIAHAYRLLLRRHHPDTRAPGDSAQQARSDATLSDVIGAYTVLSDDVRRDAYDRERAARVENAGARVENAGARTHLPPSRSVLDNGRTPTPPIVAGPVHWIPPRRRSR